MRYIIRKNTLILLTACCIALLFMSGCGKDNDLNNEITSEQNSESDEKSEGQAGDSLADDFATDNIEVIREENPEEEIMGDLFYDMDPEMLSGDKKSAFIEPILLNPTDDSVTVEWFSNHPGTDNEVIIENEEGQRVIKASTSKLSRMRGGMSEADCNDPNISADIYKHVAVVDKLPEYHGLVNQRVKYRVRTDEEYSDMYTLSAKAQEGTPLKLLLTSDHQTKPMTAANIQKVYETVGCVDGVLVNGDIVDVIDRCYDWFYADNAFLRVMTGTAEDEINGTIYHGAPLLQQAPIYTAMGNHDVMGVYDNSKDLAYQFNNPRPRQAARKQWEQSNLKDKSEEEFVRDNSYNTITYGEMFGTVSGEGNTTEYYATSIGDVRLISLDVNRVWRLSNIGLAGKYSEIPGMGEETYGYGDFIFERVDEDSDQIAFLKKETGSDRYKEAKIKMVMFHHEAHSLGGNQIPAFTDPVAGQAISPITGQSMVIYDYPIEKDYIINVIEPILEDSKTNLLFEGHSHVWNRFRTDRGMNILETSNVGNSYGGYTDEDRNEKPSAFNADDPYHLIADKWDRDNYELTGDPNGLSPIAPSVANLPENKLYIASNTITVFSILDTKKGTVDSYYYDTEDPNASVVLFDSFNVNE